MKQVYPTFLIKFETQLLTKSNIKEVHGPLIDFPEKYYIVSEIAKNVIIL